MSQKICITSTRSVGCTFVDWSVHFLTGQHNYYHAKSQQLIPLSRNPVGQMNAHGHEKNHPAGCDNFLKELDLFDQQPQQQVCSTYPIMMHYDAALAQLGYTADQLSDSAVLNTVNQWILQDYNQLFGQCRDRDTKLIFVATDSNSVLYHQHVRALDRFMTSPHKPTTAAELAQEFQEIFFSSSLQAWSSMNLDNIWDIRERMALDIRPFDTGVAEHFDFAQPHLWISCQQLWQQPDHTLSKILDYCGLATDPARWQQWLPIARRWQQLQLQLLQFGHVYQHIVDAVVNNWDYQIDLSFDQEVIIQHCLIYQHNLNLKTWQLSKFPSNTQALHQLLEPNIHPVSCIY
jgi:hypothetical protein